MSHPVIKHIVIDKVSRKHTIFNCPWINKLRLRLYQLQFVGCSCWVKKDAALVSGERDGKFHSFPRLEAVLTSSTRHKGGNRTFRRVSSTAAKHCILCPFTFKNLSKMYYKFYIFQWYITVSCLMSICRCRILFKPVLLLISNYILGQSSENFFLSAPIFTGLKKQHSED